MGCDEGFLTDPRRFMCHPRHRRADTGAGDVPVGNCLILLILIVLMVRSPRASELTKQFQETVVMAEHTPYQRKIIERYYKHFDAIKFQRLAELATDLYLAEGKKRDRMWKQVGDDLRKLALPEPRIAHLLQARDPALLVEILKELERTQ
jgi:hypothetical protein